MEIESDGFVRYVRMDEDGDVWIVDEDGDLESATSVYIPHRMIDAVAYALRKIRGLQ
jgi:hypothetical protein